MNSLTSIREYLPSDKQAVLELLQLNTPQYFDPSEEDGFHYYLDNEIEDYFLLIQDKRIIGCGGINYFEHDSKARISWDMISPDYQGKGAGKQLLEYRIHRAKANSAVKYLEVRTTQYAHEFYGKAGFELVSITKDFWAKGFDLYLMNFKF